jgi:hypothetical protein
MFDVGRSMFDVHLFHFSIKPAAFRDSGGALRKQNVQVTLNSSQPLPHLTGDLESILLFPGYPFFDTLAQFLKFFNKPDPVRFNELAADHQTTV